MAVTELAPMRSFIVTVNVRVRDCPVAPSATSIATICGGVLSSVRKVNEWPTSRMRPVSSPLSPDSCTT